MSTVRIIGNRLFQCFAILLSVSQWIACADDGIRILPEQLTLSGPESAHRVVAERFVEGQAAGPILAAELISSNPSVVRVEGTMLIPVANGRAEIRLKDVAGCVPAVVEVVSMETPVRWSFRNHVEPVLARLGCSSGACHGALAGKGGFRLSLRGYDPDRDYITIMEQQLGRRVEMNDPAASLLLTKPTMAVPHKGGLRLQTDSSYYRVLSEWIADGAAPPTESDAALIRLEVLPDRVILSGDASQPLIVRAHYSDGRAEDVTHLAKFTSSNEAVAVVDEHGQIKVTGSGEGAVTAWFSSVIVISRVTVPYPNADASDAIAHSPSVNVIDELVLKQLKRLNLTPSPLCTDEVFIRRAFLDTIGTLPTSEEVRNFLADTAPDKRDRLIDQLLARPEFTDYWTYRWSDLLLLNGTELRPDAIAAYYKWIRGHVEANTPWDRMVRELVTAKGSSFDNGATNFFARHQAPEDMAENVSQAFLGLSIGCARCHNHPLEKWTNDQYYAFANLFSRVRAKGWGGDPRNGDGLRTLVNVSSGELIQPRTGRPQQPAPLDAEPMAFDAPGDRREYLARWLTSPDNKLFARSITNRVWKAYFGVGLVEQVDDMRASNPPSNEELLEACAETLVDRGYDLKSLMRLILQSSTYQRSSQALPGNDGDLRHYSRYYPRRMMAEVMLDAVSQVTDVPSEFTKIVYPGADVKPTDAYPKGTRAIQLKDSAVDSYFLQAFGRNQRRITCECERSDEPSMVQVLHLSNGDTLNGRLAAPDNRLKVWLQQFSDDRSLLEEVFLTCLARRPSDMEYAEILPLLANSTAEERRLVLEDVVWGIVSSREFLFNH